MIEEKKYPKRGKKEKVKNGFMKDKQRYKCKCCGCNDIGSKNDYPDHIKKKAINTILKIIVSVGENISHIGAKFCTTDKYSAYDIILDSKHLIVKSHTYTVERMNRLIRHYLSRFSRKIYC